MDEAMKHVLIAGGMGVVGRAAVEHFTSRPDCRVTALSRRPPNFPTRAAFLSIDLMDGRACREGLAGLSDVTHVVYAALHEQGDVVRGWTEGDQVRVNREMFANLLDAVEAVAPNLRHVTLMQGGKAYGVHLGPQQRVIAKESDPRTMPPNFYYDQEDHIRERQAGKAWSWSALRPPNVAGKAIGSQMNTVLAIGVFAAISREYGIPLRYPGGLGHLRDACDARILAQAMDWAGETPACAGQIYNIANGDLLRWEDAWPRFAEVFGMACGTPHAFPLARVMADKAEVWERIVARYGLQPYRIEQLVPSWEFTDFSLRFGQPPAPVLLSTIKARRDGFTACADSEEMYVELLQWYQDERILPPLTGAAP
jgi:nucleoside-diphosphate-sugar epimerase